jgi:hypothetical protein
MNVEKENDYAVAIVIKTEKNMHNLYSSPTTIRMIFMQNFGWQSQTYVSNVKVIAIPVTGRGDL